MGFWEQLRLEIWIQLRRPFVWFCFVGYFALAFSDTVQAGWGGEGNFWVNGAAIIANRAIILSLNGMLAVAGIMCDPMARDRIYGVEEMIFTTPARRLTLGLARFLGAFAIVVATSFMFVPGIILGSMMPGIPEELIGPLVWQHYYKGMAYFLIPNFFLMSAMVFLVSTRWQSRAIAFGVGIGAIALWTTARMSLGRDVLRQEVFRTYALLDPFGTIASWEFSMGKTVSQNNTTFTVLEGMLLYNRLLWMLVACLIICAAILAMPLRPRFARLKTRTHKRSRWFKPQSHSLGLQAIGLLTKQISLQEKPIQQLKTMIAWELKNIGRQPATKVCIAFILITIWRAAGSVITYQFSLPSTDLLVHTTSYFFDKTLVLAVVWTAGELIWRDFSLKVSEQIDAQPTFDTLRFLSKSITLVAIISLCWLLSIFVNAIYQASQGYYRFEWCLYFTDSFVFKAPYYVWLGALALTCQVIVRNRYIAIGIVLLVYLSEVLFNALDWFHPMVRYGRVSHFYYSLMNGYGHFWPAHFWTSLYWSLAALSIWLIGWGSFFRGSNPPPRKWYWKRRLLSKYGFTAISISLALFLGVGAYLWYQSTVLATWPPLNEDHHNAQVERKYKSAWQYAPHPRVIKIKGDLQLYPMEQRFELKGMFELQNLNDTPITDLFIPVRADVEVQLIKFDREAELVDFDEELNIRFWRLQNPLLPGERMDMEFKTSGSCSDGIAMHAKDDNRLEVSEIEVVENGTSLLNLQIMPGMGYTDRVEVKPAWKRRRLGLPEKWSAPIGDVSRNQGHALLHLAWVESIEMTIHTDADQIAVHAGKLIREWQEPDGRRAFEYRIDHRSRGWSTITSARYQTREFNRDGLPNVVVYYDSQHEPNVDFFANSIHDAMAYFRERYGPPPFQTFRLAEQALYYDGFGARAGLGFSSEVLGWKTDIAANGGEDIRRMAALMMGMGWWGDQIIPANVAGAKVLHSGLPYWTASMYLHDVLDPELDRKLRLQAMQEMFRGRSSMVDEEGPFYQEFKDSTLVRNKGSLLILYLAQLVGTQKLEAVFSEFLEEYRYRDAPYATTEDFLEYLRSRVSEKYHQQITDIFERITFWRLSVKEATCEKVPAGGWKLIANVDARKFYTSGWGDESEIELQTPIPLVAFQGQGFSDDSVIWSDTRTLQSGENQIVLELDKKPTRFGIDPYLLLTDPNPYDNVELVE